MKLLPFLGSLFRTVVSLVDRPATPTALVITNGAPDVRRTIALILESKSVSVSMLRTGGVVHRIFIGTADSDALAIITHAKANGLKISRVLSFVIQESLGDPRAENPNNQDAKPGETPAQAFAHADLGIAQLDGATLEGMPEFKGDSPAQIEAAAFDADWAVGEMCKIIAKNDVDVAAALAAEPALLKAIPGGNAEIASDNCYNAGLDGTLESLRSGKPNLTYGEQVSARTALFAFVDAA